MQRTAGLRLGSIVQVSYLTNSLKKLYRICAKDAALICEALRDTNISS